MAEENEEDYRWGDEPLELNVPVEEAKKEKPPNFVVLPVRRGSGEIIPLLMTINTLGLQDKAWVCGGHVRWMCSPRYSPEAGQDVDVYCESEEVFGKLKEYFRTQGMKEKENRMSLLFTVDKKDHENRFFSLPSIQLIKPMKVARVITNGSLKDILSNFDFTVIRIGLLNSREALADGEFFDHELTGQLRIKNIHCPISSSFRFMKYYKKGYFPKMTEIVKLFIDWDNRSDKYKMELMDLVKKKDNLSEEEIMKLEALMRID
jgi:hypothetical protein